MKARFLMALCALATLPAVAEVVRPFPATEPVLVKELQYNEDRMPSTDPNPGNRSHTRIKFEVQSSGCTEAEHFRVLVRKSANRQTLSIGRIKPDRCKRQVHRTTIELTTKEVLNPEVVPLTLLNPVYAEVSITH